MKVLVIAEAGVNHNGDFDRAVQLVRAAAEAGADIVKFQSFTAENLVAPSAQTAQYQRDNTGETSQTDMLKKLELSQEACQELAKIAKRENIEFLSTAFDEHWLDILVELGIQRIKIPSGEITNLPFLRHAAIFDLPIVLSTV